MATKYTNFVLTAIALLLLAHLFIAPTSIVPALSAQAGTRNISFSGVANPRKLFFFDQTANMVYVYDDGGKIDAVYSVGRLGQPLTKQ